MPPTIPRRVPRHVLFVCSKNQWRSPTADSIYRNQPRLHVRSAGTSKNARRRLTEDDILWADLIIAMERKHAQRMREDFPESLRSRVLHVLDIEDNYRYMDPELVAMLRASVDPILAAGDPEDHS